jgi:hypothetical protein
MNSHQKPTRRRQTNKILGYAERLAEGEGRPPKIPNQIFILCEQSAVYLLSERTNPSVAVAQSYMPASPAYVEETLNSGAIDRYKRGTGKYGIYYQW